MISNSGDDGMNGCLSYRLKGIEGMDDIEEMGKRKIRVKEMRPP